MEPDRDASLAAYWRGYANGRADKSLGHTNEYAAGGIVEADPLVSEYARGYRMGQRVGLTGDDGGRS